MFRSIFTYLFTLFPSKYILKASGPTVKPIQVNEGLTFNLADLRSGIRWFIIKLNYSFLKIISFEQMAVTESYITYISIFNYILTDNYNP